MITLNLIDDQLQANAECVLEEIGLDIETVVKMVLKRVVKEKSILFLLQDSNCTEEKNTIQKCGDSVMNNNLSANNKMTKNKAINLFRSKGTVFNGNVTFASKNRSANNYWANPAFSVLDMDWFLILNDWINSEIHLFVIPKSSILPGSFVCRNDSCSLIDLQIMYDDRSYTDTRSKVSFAKYLVSSIKY